MTDGRSSLAIKIMNANPHAYETLAVEGGTPDLARELLEVVQPDQLIAAPFTSPIAAYAMLAGLWLWHDGLSECHEIVQKSPEQLIGAALNLHSKSSKPSPNVPSVQFVENDKASNPRYLRDMASTLAFWHGISQSDCRQDWADCRARALKRCRRVRGGHDGDDTDVRGVRGELRGFVECSMNGAIGPDRFFAPEFGPPRGRTSLAF